MRTCLTLLTLSVSLVVNAQEWGAVNSGVSTSLRDVFFADPAHGWVVGDESTILVTTNGGATWVPQSAAISSVTLNSVFFTSLTDGWICGASETLLKTVNGGSTWTVVSSGGTIGYEDLWFTSPQTGYIVGGSGLTGTVKRTIDGGTTWASTDVDRVLEAVYFTASGQGWACGSRGVIYHSTDGIGWTQQVAPAVSQFSDLLNIFMLNDLEGWAVGNPVYMLHTVDAGTTWNNVDVGTGAGKTAVYFSSVQTGWVSTTASLGGGNPIRGTTNGSTWSVVLVYGPTMHNMRFLNPSFGWAVGDLGTIFRYGSGNVSVEERVTAPLVISPNPVADRLTFRADVVDHVEVYSATGEQVLRTKGMRSSIDVSTLPPGCYSIRVVAQDGYHTARFVKE